MSQAFRHSSLKLGLVSAAIVGFLAVTTATAADAPAIDKDALEKTLGVGKDKAHYRSSLEKQGFAITAINKDTPTYTEYEVIKNGHSYEVQIDFKDGVSSKVDVTTNVYKAPATAEALKNANYKYAYPTSVTADADKYSERTNAALWNDEKKAIEAKLGVGHDRAYYKTAVEKLGYKVTKVNDSDADSVEYEMVKGDHSYELEVDFDSKTKKSTKVDVSTNMWEAPATERAKGDK